MIVFLNFVTCAGGGWLCLCRMTKMSERETKLAIRCQYSLMFTFFSASGWSFAFGQMADAIQLLMSGLILTYMLIGIPAWRFSAPSYARRV